MSVKLLISLLICLGLRESNCQTTPSCPVKIYTKDLATALRNLANGEFAEPTASGMDALFTALRRGQETELVILLDNSLEVRPNHFYLVDKPSVDNFLKYHVANDIVSVSLIVFGETNYTVGCKEVLGNCDELKKCIGNTAYASVRGNGWVGTSIVKAMNEAQTILSQPSKANKQKIVLIVSGFQITSFYLQQIMPAKQNLTALGADIYTVLSSFRGRVAEATQIASSADKYTDDVNFVTKLYNTIPLGVKSCAGATALGQDANGIICKDSEGGQEICMCKLGYDGPNCETRPNHCNFATACPTGSRCSTWNDFQYSCFCPTCKAIEVCLNFEPSPSPPSPAQPPAPGPAPAIPSPVSSPPRDLPLTTPTPPNDRIRSTPPRDRVSTPPRDRVSTPPRDRVPTPPRDRVPTPPRDRVPTPPPRDTPPPVASAPRDLPPNQLQPALPPVDILLGYISALIERAKACIYPTGNNEIQG